MNIKWIMGIGFIFFVGTLLSHIGAGSWFGADEVEIYNSLTVIRGYNVLGLFTIPWVNVDFVTVGLPKLLSWDYAFFGGEYEIMRYLFYTITMGIGMGLLILALGVLTAVFRRL